MRAEKNFCPNPDGFSPYIPRMKRTIGYLFALLLIVTVASAQTDTLTFVAVGDMMLGTDFPSDKYLEADDGRNLLAPVDSLLEADLAFGNLEGVLMDGGRVYKSCKDTTKCYAFRSPTRYANYFKKAGFDALCLANNHVSDFGPPGKRSTRLMLDSLGIAHAGLDSVEQQYAILETKGKKVAFLAFSPFRGTLDMRETEEVVTVVKQADAEADLVVVSFHGGAEGKKYRNVTREMELFYGEKRGNMYEFAHACVDAGADFVFGHGPHVCRAVELYKGRLIAYSLGNFATYTRFNLDGPNGIAPALKVWLDGEGNFLKADLQPVVQTGEGGPKPDPEAKATAEIKRLTEEDFPETPLRFAGNQVLPVKKD